MNAVTQKLRDQMDRPSIKEIGPTAGIVAVAVAAALAAGVGLVIYRRRRRRSLMRRLQDALPEMDDIRSSLKRPLERAAKVL